MNKENLLAINTTYGVCAVGVGNAEKVLLKKKITTEKGASEKLIPLIDTVLKELELTINQLSGFLVCTGPGNYTSLRVAVSTVRGFALAIKKPAIGLSLFELLAARKRRSLVIVQAPLNLVYVQEFYNGLNEKAPSVVSLNELKNMPRLSRSKIIGYKAGEVAKAVGSNEIMETTEVSFQTFFSLGYSQITQKNKRPVPLYIR